jgi:hypothetical protein
VKKANNEEIGKHQRPESDPEAEAGENATRQRDVGFIVHE